MLHPNREINGRVRMRNRWHLFKNKTILTTIILLFSAIGLKAEYRPLDLYEMILGAEKIVYGEIIEMDSLRFKLKVERNLTGEEAELVIKRFENWPCAHRWTDYRIGQRLFLFLKNNNGQLHSMSGGNEGELPILNGYVYINGFSLDPPPPTNPKGQSNKISKRDFIDSKKHKVFGSDYFGHKTDLEAFTSTVTRIRNCFEIKYGKYHQIENAIIKCDEKELKKEIENNKILNWTYKKLKEKADANNG